MINIQSHVGHARQLATASSTRSQCIIKCTACVIHPLLLIRALMLHTHLLRCPPRIATRTHSGHRHPCSLTGHLVSSKRNVRSLGDDQLACLALTVCTTLIQYMGLPAIYDKHTLRKHPCMLPDNSKTQQHVTQASGGCMNQTHTSHSSTWWADGPPRDDSALCTASPHPPPPHSTQHHSIQTYKFTMLQREKFCLQDMEPWARARATQSRGCAVCSHQLPFAVVLLVQQHLPRWRSSPGSTLRGKHQQVIIS